LKLTFCNPIASKTKAIKAAHESRNFQRLLSRGRLIIKPVNFTTGLRGKEKFPASTRVRAATGSHGDTLKGASQNPLRFFTRPSDSPDTIKS
jgi:hypothetical protein